MKEIEVAWTASDFACSIQIYLKLCCGNVVWGVGGGEKGTVIEVQCTLGLQANELNLA